MLLNFPPGAVGALSGNGANGFAITGLVQNVTVIGVDCSVVLTNQPAGLPTPNGGTVTVNGIVITIPTNTIVQYPANTLSWADAVCGQTTPLLTGATRTTPAIASDGLDGSGAVRPRIYPGVEISVDGNIIAAPTNPTTPLGNPPVITGGGATAAGVGSTHVAALVHISQQSLHSGSGYISAIDYTDGSIYVSTKNSVSATSATRLMLNDPKGRYGRPQGSVDARFSVDDANPTIKAAASGYPMCVPRVAPGSPSALETDPQCPQKNRPNNAPCRNFAATGVNFRIAGADLPTALAPNGFCAGFVMRARTGMPGTFGLAASNLAGALPSMGTYGDPDPREMAPFEVGDFITWQGTLVPGGNTAPPAAALGTTNTDVIWVHTIDANVGIYTQPATLPAYIAIGGNGIGITPQPSTAVAAAGVEATPRIFMEANTTDVASIVDIYLDDKGFSLPGRNPGVIADPAGPIVADVPGSPPNEYFRWITPESKTGKLADQAANAARGVVVPASLIAQATAFGGGIETQFVGPQPGRARIRAIKIPAIDAAVGCPTTGGTRGCAVTQSPTRYIRAVLRSLCAPAATGAVSATGFAAVAKVEAKNLSTTGTNNGPFFDINGYRPSLPGAGDGEFPQWSGGRPVPSARLRDGGEGAAAVRHRRGR